MKLQGQLLFTLISIFLFQNISNAQFVNFEDTWKEFLANNKISNISEMTKPNKDQSVEYLKYCLMVANTHFCSNDIQNTEVMMSEIKKIGSSVYDPIPGYTAKHDDLAVKIKAYHQTGLLWAKFLENRNVSLEELDQVPAAKKVCEKGTLAKYFYMVAHAHYCKGEVAEAKGHFEGRVLKLAERTTLKVSDIRGLEEEVKMMKVLFTNLPKLGKSWKSYQETGKTEGFNDPLPEVECYSIPSMKAYVLQGAADVCANGSEALEKIERLQSSNTHPVGKDLQKGIDELKIAVEENNNAVANLNQSWEAFLPKDTLTNGINFGFEYCDTESMVRAHIMDGRVHYCEKGEEVLEIIEKIQADKKPNLSGITLEKLKNLQNKIKEEKDNVDNLNVLWKEFIQNKDTLLTPVNFPGFYCDKIAQIKSWTILGHMDACSNGQKYLDFINNLKANEKLEFDEELDCRVNRLQIKVWDCRYWELVLQARKETHEERERFGPASAAIMRGDLNSDQLKCETSVQYQPLGNIGIKYIISAYLCQDVDLAKMGDPEYYKKIATWVDTEVLAKYCEESMRCKEDFNIYLEGHSDGNAFRGARYKKSLDIPEGTPFTHFIDGEVLEKTTEREITNSLKSNMELGIARAWTVKHQLDFMGVPISIGTWEHPTEEKGGEYRKIEIELNINNLLLDFYEKRLAELLIESGIGERPEAC